MKACSFMKGDFMKTEKKLTVQNDLHLCGGQRQGETCFWKRKGFLRVLIKHLGFTGLLLLSISGNSQQEFSEVDKKSKKIPESLRDSREISAYLSKGLQTEKEKVRAFYIWISHNVRYDLELVRLPPKYKSHREIVRETLDRKKGVCQHYAELFHAMCKAAGIKSYLVSGYTLQKDGRISENGHAWNGVYIDSAYYLLDVTWAAGFINENAYVHQFRDVYFLMEPEEFIKSHIPFDPIWQFLDNPLSNEEFVSRDFSKMNETGDFNYQDSIAKYEKTDNLARLEGTVGRIISSGVINPLIQKKVEVNLYHIAQTKYNSAIDTLNYGIEYFNIYKVLKGRRFTNPEVNDEEIREMIQKAEKSVEKASEILQGLHSENQELGVLIEEAKGSLPFIISEINKEKVFVGAYTKKRKTFRTLMLF